MAQLVKNLPAMRETWVQFLGRSPGEGERLPTPVFWPGEFRGLYSPWGRKDLDTTKRLLLSFFTFGQQQAQPADRRAGGWTGWLLPHQPVDQQWLWSRLTTTVSAGSVGPLLVP